MQAHQRMLDPTPNGLHSGESPLLQTLGLTKRYGDFLANDSIDIDIWPKANPRAARRERRRQVDAGQGNLRADPAQRRRDSLAGRADRAVRPVGGTQPRHRHGVPALLAVRQSHRRRERRARPRRQGILQGHVGTAGAGVEDLWPAARSQTRGLAIVRRRAPAHRDRPRADAGSEIPDPGRADGGADAAGSRPALHRAGAAQGRRPRHPLHQPQARGGEAALRHRNDPARRQEGRDLQSQARDRRLARAHDGRRRDQGSEGGGRPADHGAAARRQRPLARARARRMACVSSTSRSS